MSTQKELRELKELVAMKSKAFEKSSQGVKQALETVELNNQWKINNYLLLVSRLNHMRMLQFDNEDEVTENSMTWWKFNINNNIFLIDQLKLIFSVLKLWK